MNNIDYIDYIKTFIFSVVQVSVFLGAGGSLFGDSLLLRDGHKIQGKVLGQYVNVIRIRLDSGRVLAVKKIRVRKILFQRSPKLPVSAGLGAILQSPGAVHRSPTPPPARPLQVSMFIPGLFQFQNERRTSAFVYGGVAALASFGFVLARRNYQNSVVELRSLSSSLGLLSLAAPELLQSPAAAWLYSQPFTEGRAGRDSNYNNMRFLGLSFLLVGVANFLDNLWFRGGRGAVSSNAGSRARPIFAVLPGAGPESQGGFLLGVQVSLGGGSSL